MAKYLYPDNKGYSMKYWIIFALVILVLPEVNAQERKDVYVVNSKDWRDVFSVVEFAHLRGTNPLFMVSEQHIETVLTDYEPAGVNVTAFSSKNTPWVKNFAPFAKAKNYQVTERYLDNMNLELANEVETNNFIIIDDAYGYNAIAVAGYAQVAKYYVLFANAANINEVSSFLQSRTVEKVLIYGHVDREVRDALNPYNPDIINNNGDRYANNVEILKRYKQISDARQVILSNGEFIEGEIMAGSEPVVFIGKGNIPPVIRDYVASSNIDVGILIGNELVLTATTLRRQLGISVFVKYARSARVTSGPISQVEGLDRFLLPIYEPNLKIEKFRYNSVSNQLEVTFRNLAPLAVYFSGTYTVTAGDQVQTVGDTEPLFVDGGKTKSVVYELDPIINKDSITAHAFVVYGESSNSLEWSINEDFNVEVVDIFDRSEVIIESVDFVVSGKQFVVHLKNVGDADAYVDTEAVNVLVVDEKRTFGAKEIIKISAGGTGKSFIPTELTQEDLALNKKVRIRAYFGENEGVLAKIVEGDFEYKIIRFDIAAMLPTIIISLLLLLIIAAVTKKKCPSCKKKISRWAKFCKKCGHRLG